MKFRLNIFISIMLVCLGLCSCGKDEPQKASTETKRTILVYMIANNSLGHSVNPTTLKQYDDDDLDEMLQAVTNNNIDNGRLIVYHVPPIKEGVPTLKEITSDGIVTLKTYSNTTLSTDPNQLEQVITDTYSLAPALDYGLILWSHADAWREHQNAKTIQSSNTAKPLAFGEETTSDGTSYMKVTSLAKVLNKHNFSFIYFDCCHMASIEVVYELKNATDYIIASTTELPADGMPYDLNVPCFFTDTPQLEKACQNTFNSYNNQTGVNRSCTISLIKTSYLDDLATISREIFSSKMPLPNNFKPQQFVYGTNCYSFDLEQYISALSPNDETTQQFKDVLDKVVIYKNATPYIWQGSAMEIKINFHCGLGSHILQTESDATLKGYNNHLWWQNVVKYKFQ